MVRRSDEGEAQRRRWTFYEAINSKKSESVPNPRAFSLLECGSRARTPYFSCNCSGSQETEFRSQNGNSGDVDELRRLLEEISKLLEAYSQAILNSDS